jgi:hypothetical protein
MTKMNLIDTNGLLRPVPGLAFLYPFVVTPFEAVYIENQGSRLHSMLAEEGEGITLQDYIAESSCESRICNERFRQPQERIFPRSLLRSAFASDGYGHPSY